LFQDTRSLQDIKMTANPARDQNLNRQKGFRRAYGLIRT
jgi:hypothetical protein